uniref:Uncharacterized protein n=1 Tax=Anguilla anguilla TaxID=7936 RepID=A0A0E9TMB3_ANGAN
MMAFASQIRLKVYISFFPVSIRLIISLCCLWSVKCSIFP